MADKLGGWSSKGTLFHDQGMDPEQLKEFIGLLSSRGINPSNLTKDSLNTLIQEATGTLPKKDGPCTWCEQPVDEHEKAWVKPLGYASEVPFHKACYDVYTKEREAGSEAFQRCWMRGDSTIKFYMEAPVDPDKLIPELKRHKQVVSKVKTMLDTVEGDAQEVLSSFTKLLLSNGTRPEEMTDPAFLDGFEEGIEEFLAAAKMKQAAAEDVDLENYLIVRTATLKLARGEVSIPQKYLEPCGDTQACWSAIERAKVISCSSAIQDVMKHTNRFLAKVLKEKNNVHSEVFEKDLVAEALRSVKYPENLPFPYTYLSFGGGLGSYDGAVGVADVLLGILVTDSAAWTYFANKSANRPVIPVCAYADNRWTDFASKAPWVISQLIDLINSYRTYVEEIPRSLKRKLEYERLAKGMGFKKAIPPPYYRVALHEVHIKERAETMFPTGRVLGHRHDRRGHERCKFRRGKLPMDAKLESKLTELGYDIFKSNPVDVNTFRRLSLRGLPYKAHDEWLAVKTSWVKDCVCGDESLPYVPSIHEVPSTGTGG